MSPRVYTLLADAILAVHFAYVAFVVGGLLYVWVGWPLRWRGVRNPTFRALHLAAMGLVVLESVLGVLCPLTDWEDALRMKAGGGERYQGSFLQHWVHRVMFFDLPERTFQIIYLGILAAMLTSWLLCPPRRRS